MYEKWLVAIFGVEQKEFKFLEECKYDPKYILQRSGCSRINLTAIEDAICNIALEAIQDVFNEYSDKLKNMEQSVIEELEFIKKVGERGYVEPEKIKKEIAENQKKLAAIGQDKINIGYMTPKSDFRFKDFEDDAGIVRMSCKIRNKEYYEKYIGDALQKISLESGIKFE